MLYEFSQIFLISPSCFFLICHYYRCVAVSNLCVRVCVFLLTYTHKLTQTHLNLCSTYIFIFYMPNVCCSKYKNLINAVVVIVLTLQRKNIRNSWPICCGFFPPFILMLHFSLKVQLIRMCLWTCLCLYLCCFISLHCQIIREMFAGFIRHFSFIVFRYCKCCYCPFFVDNLFASSLFLISIHGDTAHVCCCCVCGCVYFL